jgi:mannosyltransferase
VRREKLWPVLLTLAGGTVRFVGLGHQSFWVDETVTHRLIDKSFPAMLGAVAHGESTPPLYYALAWVWSRVAGSGDVSLRALSALTGTLTIPVVFAAARQLVSTRTGVIAAALAAVSPLLVWYSQEARGYALFTFLTALSLLFFARALEAPSTANLGWWASASSLALLTHYFSYYLVAAEALLLLRQHRGETVRATASVAGVGLALLPLAVYQAKYGSSAWIRSISLRLRIEETLGQLLVPSHPSIWAGAGVPEGAPKLWPLGLLVLAVGCLAIRLHGGAARRGVVVCLALGTVAVVAPLAVSIAAKLLVSGRGDVFLFRNVIDAWVPLTIAFAAAPAAARAGRAGLALATTLVAACIGVVVANGVTGHLQRDDWRLVAGATAGGDRAIVLSPSWEAGGLEYYAPALGTPAPTAGIREIDVVVRRWVPSYSPKVIAFDPPAGFRQVERRTLQNWELTVFRAAKPIRVSPAQLDDVHPRNASYVLFEQLR